MRLANHVWPYSRNKPSHHNGFWMVSNKISVLIRFYLHIIISTRDFMCKTAESSKNYITRSFNLWYNRKAHSVPPFPFLPHIIFPETKFHSLAIIFLLLSWGSGQITLKDSNSATQKIENVLTLQLFYCCSLSLTNLPLIASLFINLRVLSAIKRTFFSYTAW